MCKETSEILWCRIAVGSCIHVWFLRIITSGTVYTPSEPILIQSLHNPFVFRCADSLFIDGKRTGISKWIYRQLHCLCVCLCVFACVCLCVCVCVYVCVCVSKFYVTLYYCACVQYAKSKMLLSFESLLCDQCSLAAALKFLAGKESCLCVCWLLSHSM